MSVDYEVSLSRKRYQKNISESAEVNAEQNINNQNEDEASFVPPIKLQNDAEIASNYSASNKKSKKSKSRKSSKKSKSSRKIHSNHPHDEKYTHSLNAYTSLDNNCITQTAPFAQVPRNNLQLNADLIDAGEIISQQPISDPHQHHHDHKEHHEDASNLAYPINPFDHLMPHRDDYGTPNMAWIGDDGLVHTPCGGVYAKTTEAVANFRRELKYDSGWHRTRQRYICLILLIIFLTICAVVVLLIARSVDIVDVELIRNDNIWKMDASCALNQSVSPGCNVSIAPLLKVKIDNHNWVPATVNSIAVEHIFFCTSTLDCPSGGTEFGADAIYKDGNTEIPRKNKGYAKVNDSLQYELPSCKLKPPNGTFCEWEQSCKIKNKGVNPPGHFILELKVTAELSFALQSGTEISSIVRVGTHCNGTGIVCQVDEDVKTMESYRMFSIDGLF